MLVCKTGHHFHIILAYVGWQILRNFCYLYMNGKKNQAHINLHTVAADKPRCIFFNIWHGYRLSSPINYRIVNCLPEVLFMFLHIGIKFVGFQSLAHFQP